MLLFVGVIHSTSLEEFCLHRFCHIAFFIFLLFLYFTQHAFICFPLEVLSISVCQTFICLYLCLLSIHLPLPIPLYDTFKFPEILIIFVLYFYHCSGKPFVSSIESRGYRPYCRAPCGRCYLQVGKEKGI